MSASNSVVKCLGLKERHVSPVAAPRLATVVEGKGRSSALVDEPDYIRVYKSVDSDAPEKAISRAPNPGLPDCLASGMNVARLTRGMGRAATKRQEVRVFMCAGSSAYDVAFTKSNVTSGAIALGASTFVDFALFASEYDEVFLEKVRIRMTVWPNVGSNSSSIAVGHQYFCVAWEPYDNGVPGSALQLTSNRFTTGLQYMPVLVYSTSGTANTCSSFSVANWPSPPRYISVVGKPPPYGKSKIDQRPSQMQDAAHAADGNWHSVVISNLNFGYLKYYFGNVTVSGDASNFTASFLVDATMRFRSRTG